MQKCPSCRGVGSHEGFVDGIRDGKRQGWWGEWPCSTCEGTGNVSDELAARIAERRQVRAERLARGESQRDAANRLDVDMVTYSKWEHGQIESLTGER